MIDLNLENEIIKYTYSSNEKINFHALKKMPSEYIKYLEQRFDYTESIQEALFRLKYHIEIRPVCPICGNKVKFERAKVSRPYSLTCSPQCAKELNKLNRYKTNLERYGDVNPAKNSKIKEKQRNIYRSKEKDIIEKRNNTLKEKYGVENSFQIKEVKENLKKQWLEKYGVDNPAKRKEEKERLSKVISSKEVQEKINLTKKKNKTYAKSKTEDDSYFLLKEKYPDIIRQYRSKEYPFNCDFYIPSINTYIECNYFWTHGNFPYIESEKRCIDKLNEWKLKGTDFYKRAIIGWTIRDVLKRNTSKENNLNWFEFFDIKDLIKWLESC